MVRAVGLISGGTDSTIATKIMLDMGIEVFGLNFVTPFCTCTKNGCKHETSKLAEGLGIKIKIINGGREYIQIVKNPKHGYGKNMNPCIDCRIFMFKKAKEFMEKIGASFIFTGEVLGQRPMSQRLDTMKLIEREADLEGVVLRPLSAKHLEPTIPERNGAVDRNKLLSIRGRSRKIQKELANKLKVEYKCAAGGCKLTDPQFARRIKEAFEHDEDSFNDITLLKYGRHFRLHNSAKVVVGRNEKENFVIQNFARDNDLLFEVIGYGSPITLLRNSKHEDDIKTAASICARYSDGKNAEKVNVKIMAKKSEKVRNIQVKPMDDGDVKLLMVR
ncbi:MAG: hypothetical protein AB1779_00190 [Candidatus Thermoplasmatota archaeon]